MIFPGVKEHFERIGQHGLPSHANVQKSSTVVEILEFDFRLLLPLQPWRVERFQSHGKRACGYGRMQTA